jgi:hypothetical protein
MRLTRDTHTWQTFERILGKVAHVLERRSRCVTIAGRGCRAISAQF